MEGYPSEVRERNLAEHRLIRDAAIRLREQVGACGCSSLPGPIAQAITSLLDQVREHLEGEDATLGPGAEARPTGLGNPRRARRPAPLD